VAAAAALLVLAAQAEAATSVVGFDDLPPGTTVLDQYRPTVFFQLGDPGDPPVIRSTSQARSGSQVVDIATCAGTPEQCEFPQPQTVGRLENLARAVTVFAGYLEAGAGTDTANVKLIARDSGGGFLGESPLRTVTEGAPFNTELTFTSPTPNIQSFEVVAPASIDGPDLVGFDDLTIGFPDETQPPSFGLTASPAPVTVPRESSRTIGISINRVNGSNGDISFAASGLPPGVTASFDPNPAPGTGAATAVTLTAAADAPVSQDDSTVTITGTPAPGAGSMPATVEIPVRVVEYCRTAISFDYVDARSDECMRKEGDTFVARHMKVRVNGLLLEPLSTSSKLIIDREAKLIRSEGGTFLVSVTELPGEAPTPVWAGPIDWSLVYVPTINPNPNAPRQVTDVALPGGKSLKGLPAVRVAVWFTKAGGSQVKPTFRLNFWPFKYVGILTATGLFVSDNDNGPAWDGLEVKLDDVPVPGLMLEDVFFKYRNASSWAGGLKVTLPFLTRYSFEGAFGIKQEDFDYLRFGVGNLNIQVLPGIYLQRIAAEVRRNPWGLRGQAGFTGGPEIQDKKALSIDGIFTALLDDPMVFQLEGKAKIADKWELGEAFLRYSTDGLFELGGKAVWNLQIGYVNGQIAGWVSGRDAFNFEGSVEGCLSIDFWPDPCAGGRLLASNIGIAACLQLYSLGAGIGYYWGGEFDAFTGCDLGPWRAIQSSAVAAAELRRFELPAGLPSAAFAIDGLGASPSVTVTGPRGESISVSPEQAFAQQGDVTALMGENDTTYVLVRHPSPGIWAVSVPDGSPVPVRSVRQSRGLPRPHVRARVTGKGRRRTLHWRLRAIPGQRVRFAELGRDVASLIATTRARRGAVRFRPALGPGGRRRIVALVEHAGLPRTNLNAGSYIAPPRPRPGKPRRLRITRRGKSLRVSWRPRRPGFRHAVYVRVRDGRGLLEVVPPRRRSVVIRGVAPRYGALAKVQGLTAANGKGPAAKARIKAKRRKRPRR
jgi:hypothetical protein